MRTKALRYSIGCLLVAMACVPFAFGQTVTGSITGEVIDPSGAVVVGAKVTAENTETGVKTPTETNGSGVYTIRFLPVGTYKVAFEAKGFVPQEVAPFALEISQTAKINAKFEIGSSMTVVVRADAHPILDTYDATLGNTLTTNEIENIPLNGRNFSSLTLFQAGSIGTDPNGMSGTNAIERDNFNSGTASVNGNRQQGNNYMLEGAEDNEQQNNLIGYNPAPDAIAEVRVISGNANATYGNANGGEVVTILKSGTNHWHGSLYDLLTNEKLDAATWQNNHNGNKKNSYTQNIFGGTFGGPILRNKLFFFGDYEGLRRDQGTVLTGSVPTAAEAASGFTDLSDLLQQGGTRLDGLGRTVPTGTILDPATTRAITSGVVDPISGFTATTTGFARDPFGTCGPNTLTFTLAACGLNQLPAGRLDPNAIKLLSLYPKPTNSNLFSNFANSPKLIERRKAFDVRVDYNVSEKNQAFARFSYADDPILIPGIFGGVADGGGFQQGTQTAKADQAALSWTHVFSTNLVNEARVGFNHLHTTRISPEANNLTNIPLTYGIQGIPQGVENGGLPAFGINGLQTLGSNAFLPSDEISSTSQFTENLTKIYGKHTFKAGIEVQHVNFSTLQPPWSRGEFDYNGNLTDIPNVGGGNTGRAAFLLTPAASTVGGTNFVGGTTQVFVSNISLTDNGKNYYGGYVNDDWKVSSKLTVNLGLRWDFFGLVYEHHGAQANFVPGGPPNNSALYVVPNPITVSSSFTQLLAADGIGLVTGNQYGKGLGHSQRGNLAPRFGFAYQAASKLVVRGGFGIFYNGFENRGFSPNLGENYPFQFNFSYSNPNDGTPLTFANSPGCSTTGGTATFETGFTCSPLDPAQVLANGLALRGIQFNYKTPYTMGGNFTVQYQVTPTLSVQAGYVNSLGRHLETFPNANNPTQILPTNAQLKNGAGLNGTPGCLNGVEINGNTGGCGVLPGQGAGQGGIPFPDFGNNTSYAVTNGNSFYHSFQTKLEKRFNRGLNFLATYTYSKTQTDAGDLLNGGSTAGFRAPDVPGLGIHYEYGLASFDIRQVFHLSGGYELPFGKGKPFLNGGGVSDKVAGGWSINTSVVLQGGQPITLKCPTDTNNTGTGTTCLDNLVGDPKLGVHLVKGQPFFFGNAAAFTQPAPCTVAPCALSVLGGHPTQISGPNYKKMDFSLFKDIHLNERYLLQFRAEAFNLFNHPNFNAPGFGGNGVTAVSGATDFRNSNFGAIGSTRDAPYSPRQIQLAVKFYY